MPYSHGSRPNDSLARWSSSPHVTLQDDYVYEGTLDYDYYYDQLVPEHERFFQVRFLPTIQDIQIAHCLIVKFQLPKTPETQDTREGNGKEEENEAGFAVFTHFSENPISQHQGGGNSKHQGRGGGGGGGGANSNNRKEKKVPSRRPKVQTSSGSRATIALFLSLIILSRRREGQCYRHPHPQASGR